MEHKGFMGVDSFMNEETDLPAEYTWSLGEDISTEDNNVRMIGVNSEWVILVNQIQFAVGEKPCTTN